MSESQPAGDTQETQPGFRILIVEDEEWDAELAQRILKDGGLQFTAAVVASRNDFSGHLMSFQPHVILSDFSLPGFSGEEALRIAQQQCPHIPFLIWSGVLGDEVAVGLIKQGATDYILKDRPARLASAIQHALAAASDRAQLAGLEHQIATAQRLASQGQLADAAQAVQQTRDLLAAARNRLTSTDHQDG